MFLQAILADVQQDPEKADGLMHIQPGQSYARMLHAWHAPVGPHLAAELEGAFRLACSEDLDMTET